MTNRRSSTAAAGFALAAILLLAAAPAALAQGSFYQEVVKDGRIYVFNIMSVYQQWTATGEIGRSITRIGAGPNGETLVFDSEEAIHLYNFRHNLPGEVIVKSEEKKPAAGWSWKDGKTTFEGDRAALVLSNRVQVRFTNDLPGDPGDDSAGTFRIRRAKTKLEGWFYRKHLTYELQLNWADSSNSYLEDAVLNYDFTKGKNLVQIKGGQFKVPFGRQELTSSGSQQFVDRSIVSEEFGKGRDLGLQIWGQALHGTVEWRGGMFNGAGRNRSANDNRKYQYDGRITWQPLGDAKYSESDFESTTRPLVAVSVQAEKNDRQGATTGDDIDRTVFGGDVVFKFKGVSVFTEYFHAVAEPEIAPEFRIDGYNAQIGCFIYKRFVEVALRSATIDPSDVTVLGGSRASDDQRHERGVAINWFFNKHALKLQADYRHLRDDLLESTDRQARLQMQFIF